MSLEKLRATDPEIADLILAEERRERDVIRLIPSENYVSHAVLAATGSVLTNKYSEGYPGKRYYEGQQVIDVVGGVPGERHLEVGADGRHRAAQLVRGIRHEPPLAL